MPLSFSNILDSMGESRLDGNECILVEKVLDPNIQSINQKCQKAGLIMT